MCIYEKYRLYKVLLFFYVLFYSLTSASILFAAETSDEGSGEFSVVIGGDPEPFRVSIDGIKYSNNVMRWKKNAATTSLSLNNLKKQN